MTAWHADGRGPQLVSVRLDQPEIQVSAGAWQAVGMAESASLDVKFGGAHASLVGQPGAYLQRPGFWQGGAGIAACWYGGAAALADTLRRALAGGPATGRDPFRLAALGRVDVSLHSTAALLRHAAAWIDGNPAADASAIAIRVRQAAAEAAALTLSEVGRVLGAAPFCRDGAFARRAADLPVFIRQSHGDRDFASLGERVLDASPEPWKL
jgi:hypothetical protein